MFFFFSLQNPLTLRPRPALLGNYEFGGSCGAWASSSRRRVCGVTAADLGLLAGTARKAQFVSLGRWLGWLMNFPPPATQPNSCGHQVQRPPGSCPIRGSRLRSPLQARSEIFQSDFVLYSAFLSQSKGTWQVENSHLSDCANLPVGISTAYTRCF